MGLVFDYVFNDLIIELFACGSVERNEVALRFCVGFQYAIRPLKGSFLNRCFSLGG